jgi:hypothetical protein
METSTTTDSAASSPALDPPDTPEVGSANFATSIRENLHWLKDAVHALHHGAAGGAGAQGPAGERGPAGAAGPVGATGSFLASWRGVWDEHSTYVAGDIVSHADQEGPAVWLAVEEPGSAAPAEPVWAVILRSPAQV